MKLGRAERSSSAVGLSLQIAKCCVNPDFVDLGSVRPEILNLVFAGINDVAPKNLLKRAVVNELIVLERVEWVSAHRL